MEAKNKTKILNKQVPRYWLYIIIALGLMSGIVLAQAVSPLWSNVVSTTITQTQYVPGNPPVVMSSLASSYGTGDIVTLTATLNPIPTTYQQQQLVQFYSSTTNIALDANGAPTNMAQLNAVGNSITTVNGIASLTFKSATTGTFYFIAIETTPT